MYTVEPLHYFILANSYEIACGDPSGSAGIAQVLNQPKNQLDGSGKIQGSTRYLVLCHLLPLLFLRDSMGVFVIIGLLEFFKSFVVSFILINHKKESAPNIFLSLKS